MKLPISAVILTYNEEKNIENCLKSIGDFIEEIFIVDSFSTDKTLDIVKQYTDKIFQHEFENYGKQRNWALKALPVKTEWVLNLNSDQRLTEDLKEELTRIFCKNQYLDCDGFLFARKTIFMGRWIKYGGHYPVYDAILFRHGLGICEESRYDQVFTVNGKIKKICGDVEDIVTDSLVNFTGRHNRWSSLEAIDQVLGEDQISRKEGVKQNFFGNPMEKRRFLKASYMHLPLFIRSFTYLFYRYFLKLGFLDGVEGLIFHFLQGFWFRFLVDAKIHEIKKQINKKGKDPRTVINEFYSLNL